MDETGALAALSALSASTRLRMVKALVRAGEAGMSAGEIAAAAGASPSRASFHLSGLATAGLVRSERVAREVMYRVDFGAMGALLSYLLHDCCEGHASVARCCAASENAPKKGKNG